MARNWYDGPTTLQSKVRGLMLGLALGDAVGAKAGDISGSGVLASGAATQLAAWTIEGLLRSYTRTRDPLNHSGHVILGAYQRWAILRGEAHIESTRMLRALADVEEGAGHGDGWLIHVPAMGERRGNSPTTLKALRQLQPVTSRGCQSLIRTLPIAALTMMFQSEYFAEYDKPEPSNDELIECVATLGQSLSRLTHDDQGDSVVEAAVHILRRHLFSYPSVYAVEIDPVRDLSSTSLGRLREARDAAISEPGHEGILVRLAPDKSSLSALAGGLYVAISYPERDMVRDALQFASRAPDGDSVAAVAGAMIGAAAGYEALPVDLVSRLEMGWVMDRLAIDYHALLVGGHTSSKGKLSGSWAPLGDVSWSYKYPGF